MYLGTYEIDEYVAIPAVTHRFSSGAAYAPSAITYSIYEEGNTTGLDEDVDMTPASPFDSVTGFYYARRQLTAAAGFERNKTYVVVVKATVDSVAAIEAHVFQVRAIQTGDSFARIGTAGAGLTAVPWNAAWDAEVQSEVQDAIEANNLDHLVKVADADDVADNSIIAKLACKTVGTADWTTFNNTTDSLEAIRDRGDQAWLTGSGAAASASYTTTSWTRTVGDDDGGTGSDTTTVDGTYFSTGETNAGTYLEVDAVFSVTDGESAVSLDVWGFYNGGGSHYIQVRAYNYTDSTWEPIGVIGVGTEVQKYSFNLAPGNTDPTTDQVAIKFLHAGGAGVGTHVFSVDKAEVNTAVPVVNLTAADVREEMDANSTQLAAIVEDTAEIGVAGAGLSAVPWNAAWDAEVQSECTDALNAYDPPTNAEMEARTIVAANYATAADLATVDTVVDAILVDTGTTIPAALTTIDDEIAVIDGIVDAILVDTGTDGVALATGSITTTTFAAAAIDAAAVAQSAGQEIADEVLNRNLAGGGSGNTRNVRNALRLLRNKAGIAAGTLTVCEEDDTTAAWTAAVTTAEGNPISEVDPA